MARVASDVDRELNAYRARVAGVRAAVRRDIASWWQDMPSFDPETVRRETARFVQALVAVHGEVAAAVAADFYDELRAGAPGAAKAYRAGLVGAVPDERLFKAAGWAAQPVDRLDDLGEEAAISAVAGRLSQVADELVIGQARRTIHHAAERDPDRPRVARVPKGRTTCAFCMMLAGRGPVYWSKKSAVGVSPDHYHADCDCEPVVVWEGSDLPSHYDPDGYNAAYWQARATVTGGDPLKSLSSEATKEILAVMRQQQGLER